MDDAREAQAGIEVTTYADAYLKLVAERPQMTVEQSLANAESNFRRNLVQSGFFGVYECAMFEAERILNLRAKLKSP